MWSQVGLRKHHYEQSYWRWWNSSGAISNTDRWCCESAALNIPANWENLAVATGLEKVSFIPIPRKGNAKERSNYRTIALISHASKFSSVQLLSHIRLFATPWIAAHQASLAITNFQSSLRLMSIEWVMPSSHRILCHPLLLLPPIPPSIRVFSNESTLCMRWPKYWSFSFSISPSNEHTQDWSPLEWTGWISLQSKGLSGVFSNTTVQKHQFFSAQLSSQSNSHIHTWLLEKP